MKEIIIFIVVMLYSSNCLSQYIYDIDNDGNNDTCFQAYTNVNRSLIWCYRINGVLSNLEVEKRLGYSIHPISSQFPINSKHINGYLKGITLSSKKLPFEVHKKLGPKAKWYYSRKHESSEVLISSPVKLDSLTMNPEVSLDQSYFLGNKINNDQYFVGTYVFCGSLSKTKKENIFERDTIVTLGNFITRKHNNQYELLFFEDKYYDSISVDKVKNRYYVFTGMRFSFSDSGTTVTKSGFLYDSITNRYCSLGFNFIYSESLINKFIGILNDSSERKKKVVIVEKKLKNYDLFLPLGSILLFFAIVVYGIKKK